MNKNTLLFFVRPIYRFFQGKRKASGSSHQKREARQGVEQLRQDWQQLWHKLAEQGKAENPYEYPWLLILGTEGAGKTFWLVDSGFERVIGEQQGASGIVFWTGEHAVVIELAGDYYRNEKTENEDLVWQQLIRLLRKKRPRQPLTGILTILSIDQLMIKHPNSLLELGRQIRQRLQGLYLAFSLQLPVWMLLTQADRMSGFANFFRHFSYLEQSAPCGFRLPEGYSKKQFNEAFNSFHQSLFPSLLSHSFSEKTTESRRFQLQFFLQLSMLGERLHFFCDEVFQAQQGDVRPRLCGVWLNSCHQQGTAVNLMASEIAVKRGFNVKSEQVQVTEAHSYFNRRFVYRVVLNELSKVGESLIARKIWLSRLSALGGLAIGLLAVVMVAFWYQVDYNRSLIRELKRTLPAYEAAMVDLGEQPTLPQVIAPLDSLRSLKLKYDKTREWQYHFGLLDASMAERVKSTYAGQLKRWLLMPMTAYLKSSLEHALASHSDSLIDDLHYYLMLFEPELMDHGAFSEHIVYQASQRELSLYSQQKLELLLADLWESPISGIYPDKHLIDQARQALARKSDEQLIYEHIQALEDYSGRISYDLLLGGRVLEIFQVENQEQGFPVFYTRNVYQLLDLSPTSGLVRREVDNLSMIRKGKKSAAFSEYERVSRLIRQLYFQDYIRHWQNLISNISLRPSEDHGQLARQLSHLFQGERAALYALINVIAMETSLADDPEPESQKKGEQATGLSTESRFDALQMVVRPSSPASVNQAFRMYSDYSADHQTEITQTLTELLKDVQTIDALGNSGIGAYEQMIKLMNSEKSHLEDMFRLAAAEESQARLWLTQLSNGILASYIAGAAEYLQEDWSSKVYSFWQQYLGSYFPVEPSSKQDARVDAFIEFFKPQGIFDRFVNLTLKSFIQPGENGWEVKSFNGPHIPLSDDFLRQITHIENLRRAFFSADGRIQINYRLRCRDLSVTASELSIRDSQGRFVYRHGPQIWQDRRWSGSVTENITVALSRDGVLLAQQSYGGPWAWFHYLFEGQQWRSNDQVEVQHNMGGFKSTLELALDRHFNPFNPAIFNRVEIPRNILR